MTTMVKYDTLDSLNDTKYEWTIKVRVIRIWDSYSSKGDKEFKGRNMLLLDDKHNRIHAFIWPNYMKDLKNSFEEGKIYSINNFAVKTYRKEALRCTRYDKQIWLSNHTKVICIEDDTKSDKMIRQMEFDFFDIGDIKEMSKEADNNRLIDIIGVLKDRDVLRRFKNQKEIEQCSYRFTLTDGSASIKLCFWDEMAESFSSELDKNIDTPIVVIVASGKLNEYKAETYLSNIGATRFYINYDHRSVDQMKYRASLPDFYNEKVNLPDREFESTKVMSIAHLRDLDSRFIAKKVMCQVTVRSVKETHDWNYDVCSSCQNEVEIINGKYKCEECKRNIPFPDKRFRLCLMVEDATGGAAFILFNREVESIIGKTVYDVLIESNKDGKNADFPNIFKTIEGKEYTITICLTEENIKKGSHNYFAVDIYEGFELIENGKLDDDADFSVGSKISETSLQNSSSCSMINNSFKTPDTQKSANTNRLKRINNEGIISITNLDDENDGDEHEVQLKKKVHLQPIKKEKVEAESVAM